MKPTRYARITHEILNLKAKTLLEVGTWNGDRAIEMLRAAMEATGGDGVYYGFDLFEDMTPEKSAKEFNVKTPSPAKVVVDRILAALPGAQGRVVIFKGDTRKTLWDFSKYPDRPTFDLAWIDGGHSVVTIQSDFSYVMMVMRRGGVILLDDYYSGPVPVDTKKFGCNTLVDYLIREGTLIVEIFPEKDPVKGGGFVQIAKVSL